MTVIWIAIIVAGLAIAAITLFKKLDTERLACYEAMADQFYERIKPIVDDNETPDEILDLVSFMNETITAPGSARALIGTLYKRDDGKENNHVVEVEFLKRRPELTKPFMESMASALLAITYNDILCGWFARRLLMIVQRHNKVAPIVAEDFREYSGKIAQPA